MNLDFSKYAAFGFARQGKVLSITLNNPDSLNAFDESAHAELSRVFVDAAEDEGSEIIVLTGAGKAFSAGGNIQLMRRHYENEKAWGRTIREAKRVVFSLLDCEKPVVCKMNGDAVGLGATLALLCDVVIANEDARIGDPHNNVGLIAGDGGSVIWPQLVGFARAKHYLFTGELMTARDAQAMGLIWSAVPAAELDAAVQAYVQRLLKLPLQSIKWTKQTMNIALKQIAGSMMDAGLAYEGIAGRSQDHLEAIQAFEQRRKPVFGGVQ